MKKRASCRKPVTRSRRRTHLSTVMGGDYISTHLSNRDVEEVLTLSAVTEGGRSSQQGKPPPAFPPCSGCVFPRASARMATFLRRRSPPRTAREALSIIRSLRCHDVANVSQRRPSGFVIRAVMGVRNKVAACSASRRTDSYFDAKIPRARLLSFAPRPAELFYGAHGNGCRAHYA